MWYYEQQQGGYNIHDKGAIDMTEEEAIKTLNLLTIFDAPKLKEAVQMAISALKASELERKINCEDR